MAIKEQTIEAISIKKLNGVAHTGSQFALANESKGTGLSMKASTIFAEVVPSNVSELNLIGLGQTNTGATIERVLLQATAMAGTNNTGGHAQTYELSIPLDYNGVLGVEVKGKKLHESSGKIQLIPATFAPVDPSTGLSPYKARLYSNTPSPSTLINDASDIREFIVDYFNGTIFLDNPQSTSSQNAIRFVEAFIYVGEFVDSNTANFASFITGVTVSGDQLVFTSYDGTQTTTTVASSEVFNVIATGDTENITYTLSENFKPNTTRVYVNGLRMLIGEDRDYKELQENKIQFNYSLDSEDTVMVDYLK
jgi:hypothetical protein